MYVNPFLGGVISTLFVEMVIIFLVVLLKGGGDE